MIHTKVAGIRQRRQPRLTIWPTTSLAECSNGKSGVATQPDLDKCEPCEFRTKSQTAATKNMRPIDTCQAIQLATFSFLVDSNTSPLSKNRTKRPTILCPRRERFAILWAVNVHSDPKTPAHLADSNFWVNESDSSSSLNLFGLLSKSGFKTRVVQFSPKFVRRFRKPCRSQAN